MTGQEDEFFSETASGGFSQHSWNTPTQMCGYKHSHGGRRKVRFTWGFFIAERSFCVVGRCLDATLAVSPDTCGVELCDLPSQRIVWTTDVFSMLTVFDLFQYDHQGSMCNLTLTDTEVHTHLMTSGIQHYRTFVLD